MLRVALQLLQRLPIDRVVQSATLNDHGNHRGHTGREGECRPCYTLAGEQFVDQFSKK